MDVNKDSAAKVFDLVFVANQFCLYILTFLTRLEFNAASLGIYILPLSSLLRPKKRNTECEHFTSGKLYRSTCRIFISLTAHYPLMS